MKKFAFITALLLTLFTAQAKRMQYTCELVGGAQLIGIWETKDLAKNLRSPKTILKGDIEALKDIAIDNSRLEHILSKAKDKQVILMFQVYNKQAYLRSMLWHETSFNKNLESVNAILKQQALIKKWPSLNIEEKLANTHLIVSGQAKDTGKVCPTSHYVKLNKVYKGTPLKRLSIITVNYKTLNKDSLILMQKQAGTGPAYRVMGIIPLEKAQDYLTALKKN